MRPVIVSIGPSLASSANDIALSQTPGAAGALTINGSLAVTTLGVTTAVLATPQRVLITTADTTTTFTITGTTASGALLTESFLVTGGSTYSALDYAVVTSIKVNQGTTAAVTVGTNGIGSTPWVRCDEWANAQIAIQCNVTGTVNYTVQSTLDDPNRPWDTPPLPSAMTWVNTSDTAAVGATATVQTNFAYCPTFVRVLLNSGSGSVTTTVLQSNAAPY